MIMTKLLPKERDLNTPVIAPRAQFTQTLSEITRGFLDNLPFSNLVMGGGCLIGSLLPVLADRWMQSLSEIGTKEEGVIELSTYGLEGDERRLQDKIREISKYIADFQQKVAPEREVYVIRSMSSLIFVLGHPFRNIRLSLM